MPLTVLEKSHSPAPPHSGIRPLEAGDRERLRDLLIATERFTVEEVGIALELIDAVLQDPDQKDYIIAVFEEAGAAAGYYCLGPTPGTEGTYDLYWIAVHPDRQGKGVGTQLDGAAERLVRSRGGRLIIAETSSQARYEPTREFYRRRGYAELSRIRDYYRRGDDLVVYGKYLD